MRAIERSDNSVLVRYCETQGQVLWRGQRKYSRAWARMTIGSSPLNCPCSGQGHPSGVSSLWAITPYNTEMRKKKKKQPTNVHVTSKAPILNEKTFLVWHWAHSNANQEPDIQYTGMNWVYKCSDVQKYNRGADRDRWRTFLWKVCAHAVFDKVNLHPHF